MGSKEEDKGVKAKEVVVGGGGGGERRRTRGGRDGPTAVIPSHLFSLAVR